MRAYLIAIWATVGAALLGAIYVSLGGRALFRAGEQPERVVGKRVQLRSLESGPTGLDPNPNHLTLLPALVEAYEPGVGYMIRFETPVEWLARPETHATVSARSVGYPISLVAGVLPRDVWVSGCFGSGETFRGVLQRARGRRGLPCNTTLERPRFARRSP